MKKIKFTSKLVALAWLALLALTQLSTAVAQSNGIPNLFTFQGVLEPGDGPATIIVCPYGRLNCGCPLPPLCPYCPVYDFSNNIYSSDTNVFTVGGFETNVVQLATNGGFTMQFTVSPSLLQSVQSVAGNLYLQVWVKGFSDTNFAALSPAQQVTAVPFAAIANTAATVSGPIPASQLSGQVGNGQLVNSTITINPGPGLAGGGTVALGGSITLSATGGGGSNGVTSLTGNSDITVSSSTGAITLGDTATSAATPNLIVKRDASGSFSAGSVTVNSNLYLPFPATIYSGGNTLLVEEGSFFVGLNAGQGAAAGANDVGVGDNVLSSGDTGGENVAVGEQALRSNTTGSNNVALGYQALQDNTSGFANTAVGYQALHSNTNGQQNTASGYEALASNTRGLANTANGFEALSANTAGQYNTATGDQALKSNTTGVQNTANGYVALSANSTGGNNTAFGFWALTLNTTGSGNTGEGADVLYWNATGQNNTAIGYGALAQLGINGSAGGSDNIALGYQAGSSYTANESANIDIGNPGIAGENDIIRIGVEGTQTNTFVAGIYSTPIAGPMQPVFVNSAGQLGATPTVPAVNLPGGGSFNFNGSPGLVVSGTPTLGGSVTLSNTGVLTVTALPPLSYSGGQNPQISLTGVVPSGSLSGTYGNAVTFNNPGNSFSGDGSSLSNVPAVSLTSGVALGAGSGNAILYGAIDSFIGGGQGNTTIGNYSFVGGGQANDPGNYSSVLGGFNNVCTANYSAIAGGSFNTINTNANYSFIGDGATNRIQNYASYSVIGGGLNNIVSTSAAYATLAGGTYNTAGGEYATVSGGYVNNATAQAATVSGGQQNTASGIGSFVGGGGYDGTTYGGNNNAANAATISGGLNNNIQSSANYAFVGGGGTNLIQASSPDAVIAGGAFNTISNSSAAAVIAGGANCIIGANAGWSFIGGGQNNLAYSGWSVLGGGQNNTIVYGTSESTIGGGQANIIFGGSFQSTISGGYANSNSGNYATIPGGFQNRATGASSFAAGKEAQAVNNDSFVWGDGSAVTTSTANDQFMARASGGVIIYSSSGNTAGVSLAAGSGTWSSLSDRNAKNGFAPVTARQVLAKVSELPLTTWSYKTEPGVRHVGPMAQDFYAAFDVGEDDRHIADLDESGVALAAIQGLNQKVEEKDVEIRNLEKKVDELEGLVKQLAGQK